MINPSYVGNETNRYIYCATLGNETISKKAQESYWFNGFYKYDTELRRIVRQVKYDRESHGGEVQFVPRENATAEDDGYLMTYVYDPTDDSTDFCIWDAKTCELTMKARTKERVPHGFHGLWIDAVDLEDEEQSRAAT